MTDQPEEPKAPENEEKKAPPKIKLTPPPSLSTPSSTPKIKLTTAAAEEPGAEKKETSRVDLPKTPDSKPATPKIKLTPPAAGQQNALKKETTRVDLPKTPNPKSTTVTVPPLKSTTSEVKPPPLVSPTHHSTPKTIKIKKPSSNVINPQAANMGKKETSRVDIRHALASNAGELQQEPTKKPKTITLKRPDSGSPKTADDPKKIIASAQKSETSRIELPTEATTQEDQPRKTVTIKRTAAPALKLKEDKPAASSEEPDFEIPDIVIESEEESTVLFSILSLVATIIVCVVLYILAAQTIFPDLPWAGKI